jgi:uncharacterized membrane protein YciS (DUF1049 family)
VTAFGKGRVRIPLPPAPPERRTVPALYIALAVFVAATVIGGALYLRNTVSAMRSASALERIADSLDHNPALCACSEH